MSKLKGVKGFNKDLTCRGFQYEEGKEFETENASCCNTGFHFCENPIDVLRYYSPGQSVYHEVEGDGKFDRHGDDSKVACTKIKIGAKLSIPALCKLTFDYVKSRCTNEYNAEPGKPATAGNYGAATAGENGAATAGENGAATAGENGAATAGENGAATSRGSSSSGTNGLSVARGNNVRVKGGPGAILVICEENSDNYDPKDYAMAVVDGERIKPDTWYKLVDGEFVEAD